MFLHAGVRNRFLASLPPSDVAALLPHLRNVVLQPGQVLWRRGEMMDRVVMPHSGIVSLGIPTGASQAVECGLVGREGIVGGLDGCSAGRATVSATVRVEGTATQIDAETLGPLLSQNQALHNRLLQFEISQRAQAQQTAACNAAHPVEGRMCRWLLEIHDRADNNRLSLTQEFLSTILGVRRTTVTFVAGTLQSLGAIRWQRNYAIILNREILEERSCSCYAELKECLGHVVPNGNGGDAHSGNGVDHHPKLAPAAA
jgi:CRP-like cAMP-binding protein